MKKEIKNRKWLGRLNKVLSPPLSWSFIGCVCQNKRAIVAVRFRLEYEDLFSPYPVKQLCTWDATAEDVAIIIGEEPDGAEWFFSCDDDISLVVESRPSGNRRADMVKYPPVNHHMKESE